MTVVDAIRAELQIESAGPFGAVIRGVDARVLDEHTVARLRSTILEHKVIVLREQYLTLEEQTEFAQRFGQIQDHPIVPYPDFAWLHSVGHNGRAEYWHSDMAFLPNPPFGTILSLPVQPERGGDTMFVDLEAAYLGLSAPVRDLVDRLTAVHYADEFQDWAFGPSIDDDRRLEILGWAARGAEHPLVKVHPETGRRSLFAPTGFARKVKGLTREESAGVLSLLHAHVDRPEYHLRWQWRPGDLVFWDNRNTLHRGVNDYGDAERPLQRVTVADVEAR